MYRSFANTLSDTNLALHCFLLQLEQHIYDHDSLPDVIYFQIDGGSENANSTTLAMCELMIARRLTKRIYITRLPVGHTHEDLDAKYGHIWKNVRCDQLLSPQVTFL